MFSLYNFLFILIFITFIIYLFVGAHSIQELILPLYHVGSRETVELVCNQLHLLIHFPSLCLFDSLITGSYSSPAQPQTHSNLCDSIF